LLLAPHRGHLRGLVRLSGDGSAGTGRGRRGGRAHGPGHQCRPGRRGGSGTAQDDRGPTVTDAHTAVIFPGQGAQKSGMGAAWRESGSWSLVADLSEHTGVDVEELLLSADDETLRRTDLAQIAV